MKYIQYDIVTNVWLFPGMSGWHFASIPKDISDDIRRHTGDMKHGWGSVPVTVTIGTTTWKTSIFPDKESGGYLLPLKADVRKKEHIAADSSVALRLEI